MNILIIEDNQEKLSQISTLFIVDLNIDKVNITKAENQEDAIQALEQYSFDLIVLDMSLPKFNSLDSDIKHLAGKDILIFLKHKRINIPTVVLTAHDVFGHHEQLISLNKLTEELNKRFKKFLKGVFAWESSSDVWKQKIKKVMEEL